MQESIVQAFRNNAYIRHVSRFDQQQFMQIDGYLQRLIKRKDSSLEQTHFFNGRFENLYVRSNTHPLLQQLMSESISICAEIIRLKEETLKIGFWFNLMQPGQVTTLHTHDDLDEVVSGVIYLKVPESSGDLVLYHQNKRIIVQPRVGDFLFFAPATPHEVTANLSSDYRLSIGMNIGISKALQT